MLNWADHALCFGMNPDDFFPEQGQSSNERTKEAQKVCKKCPVRTECLMHALNLPESFGIWGGIPNRSRMKISRKYGIPITYENAKDAIRNYDNAI